MFFIAIVLSIFRSKVREALRSRIGQIKKTKEFFNNVQNNNLVYWFHSASHGEFEQIHPILHNLKEIQGSSIIVVSFSSPSGYKNVEDENIDLKIYLPLDFLWNTIRILKVIRPQKLIFAEYDLWPNYIWTAKWMNIQTTLFSARFYKKTIKLRPVIKNFYKNVYSSVSAIYTISELDHVNLKKVLIRNYPGVLRVLGSPRYDRVKSISVKSNQNNKNIYTINRSFRLVAGSVWPEDDRIVLESLIELTLKIDKFSFTWAPHEPDSNYIKETTRKLFSYGLTPELLSNVVTGTNSKCIIIDKIGYLAKHYWGAKFAYIGGGFSTGVHNVMEPAIAKLPTIFGPKYHNSHTAEELIKYGGGFTVNSNNEFINVIKKLIQDDSFYSNSSLASSEVINRNLGSSSRVLRGILSD
ncbi:MAG: hypothetical protein CMH79_04005 [Nitrospinae bacterium]|nr:hypothetical protein [Nitrospinota bacterium]